MDKKLYRKICAYKKQMLQIEWRIKQKQDWIIMITNDLHSVLQTEEKKEQLNRLLSSHLVGVENLRKKKIILSEKFIKHNSKETEWMTRRIKILFAHAGSKGYGDEFY